MPAKSSPPARPSRRTLAAERQAPPRRRRRSTPPADTFERRLEWLDARRRELRCSQADLGRALGVSASSVSRLFGRDKAKRPRALASDDGLQRIELALRLLGQAAPNAGVARPAACGSAARTQAPHLQALKSLSSSRLAQPALLSDSGVFPIPANKGRLAASRMYRLLVAEDDADTVNLYEMVFAESDERLQFQVTVARTARDCIDRLRQAPAPFDLLLMDLGIAEPRDAAEPHLLVWMRAHPDLCPPRVLVVSGAAPSQFQARLADLKALNAAYLPKPFDVDEVLATVRALCERNAAVEGGARLSPAPA